MSSLLLLDCYLWESSQALVDDITAMAAAAFSDWTRCVNFFAQHQCLWWLMRTVKNRLKRLASNGKKTRARFILIRTHTHTRSPFSFSFFFFKDQTEAGRSTPPRPHLQVQHDNRIHEISPFRFSMISNFLVFWHVERNLQKACLHWSLKLKHFCLFKDATEQLISIC